MRYITIIAITCLLGTNRVSSYNQDQLIRYIHNAQEKAEFFFLFFLSKFEKCVKTPTGNSQFKADDLQSYLHSPARTTVGVAPIYTGNRKYFANMVGTTEFKEMLAEDTKRMHQDLLEKVKYCDGIVLDPDMMRHYYSRGPDEVGH